jgi:hypothetical protein
MNREEILDKSRRENQSADERERLVQAQAGTRAMAVGVLLCTGILLAETILGWTISLQIWVVYLGMLATRSLVRFRPLRRTQDLLLGLLYLTVAAVFLVMYFLGL